VGGYLARRLAAMPLLVLGLLTIVFFTSRLLPANPLVAIVGQRNMGDATVVAAAKARWGLDGGVFTQYWDYLRNVARGDLGISFVTQTPVRADLGHRLPATLELAVLALVFGGVGGVVLGVVSARRQNSPADHASRVFALVGSSVPVFWLALIALFVLYARLGWFPGPGRLPPRVAPPGHITGFYTIDALLSGNVALAREAFIRLVLPAAVMGWSLVGTISRIVRAAVLDEMHADYVRTARAKGLREGAVMRRHVLRNALLPLLTILGFSFATLLTAAVLVETIFDWDGFGSYAVAAAGNVDYPALNGVCLVAGLIFLLCNLVTDVLYAVVDPRVRLS
jgi:ABC-type dipeptide/oligopeptide/nickel transport system permease component